MTIGLLNHNVGSSAVGVSSVAAAAINSTTGSNFYFGVSVNSNRTISSISDTINGSASGNTWTLVRATTGSAGQAAMHVYKCEGGNGGTNHIVQTNGVASDGAHSVYIVEVGDAGATDLDVGQIDTASPFTSGATGTTSQANELLLAFIGGDSASGTATHAVSGETPSGGWTIHREVTDTATWVGAVASRGVTSAGAYEAGFTEVNATQAAVVLLTIRQASAGGPTVSGKYRSLLGAG